MVRQAFWESLHLFKLGSQYIFLWKKKGKLFLNYAVTPSYLEHYGFDRMAEKA